jgi:thiol-disulfide isomerase/thioredoxin
MSEEQTPMSPDFEDSNSEYGDGPKSNERVINIGGGTLITAVLAVAVIAGGWYLGRWIGARGEVATTPVTSNAGAPQLQASVTQIEANPADGQLQAVPPSGGADTVVIVPTPAGLGGIRDDQVIPMPERFHPLVGQPAPDFTMTLLETGEDVSISDYLGRPILVNYWATWCPPCRREMPFLQAMHDKYADQGFAVLAVDAGEKVPPSMMLDTINRYINSAGLTFPVLYGDNTYDVQREWSVLGLPGSFMIDTNGIVTAYHSGMYPNTATLEDHMLRTLPSLGGGATIDGEASSEG